MAKMRIALGQLFSFEDEPKKEVAAPITGADVMGWTGLRGGQWEVLADSKTDISVELRDTGSVIVRADGRPMLAMKIGERLWVTESGVLSKKAHAVIERLKEDPEVTVFVVKKVSKTGPHPGAIYYDFEYGRRT
jgi:hypothetical protein